MNNYIKGLIEEGEHYQQDFKFLINDSKKIAKSFSAFANTYGGRLLVGVKDNGVVAGVRSDEEIYMLEAASNLYLKPAIEFSKKVWNVEGKIVVEATIPKGMNFPYKALSEEGKWLAYVRVKDQNYLANSVQMKIWNNVRFKRNIRIRYEKEEQWLMDYLNQNQRISLNLFAKKVKISRHVAENIIVKLIMVNVLKLNYSETGAFYTLA